VKHRTRCPVAPPVRCLCYNSRVIFGKGKGKGNVPRTACTVRASQAEHDFSFQQFAGSATFSFL
jgi:hypothetical protein